MSVTSPGPSQEPATFAANGDLHILGGNYVTNHITNQIYIDNERRPSGSRKNTAQALERLFQHCAQHAIHTSETVSAQGMCLGGTRTATIQHLSDHLASTDPNAHDILWFRGPAGGGKSAVMRTIASTLTNEPDTPGPPVASFFFFRADNRRNTASDFISTLAYQISCAWPSTQPFIAAAIQNDHTIFTQSLLRQARALLADPILRASEADPKQTFNPAMLIDGLDECTGPDSKKAEVVDALAAVATSIRKHGKSRIKILIASRPEHVIQSRFDLHARNNVASIFTLNPSDAELGLFFDTKLQEMREAHGLPEDWPSPKQRQILIDKTSGQYAFADTAMKYTAGGDPRQRLEKVLSAMSKSADPVQPLAPLYQLYAFVFAQIPPELLPKALDVVGAIIFNRNLSQPALTLLLDLPTGFFRQLSLYLSSLFDFHIDHWHTRVYHATLGDFLFNTAKSGQFNLYIDRRRVYTLLAEGFLSLPAKVSGDDARAAFFVMTRTLSPSPIHFIDVPLPGPSASRTPHTVHWLEGLAPILEASSHQDRSISSIFAEIDVSRLDPCAAVLLLYVLLQIRAYIFKFRYATIKRTALGWMKYPRSSFVSRRCLSRVQAHIKKHKDHQALLDAFFR